jgi:hypothetical protein
MKPLNEAVIHLINEDVVNAKKLIENELYIRLGTILEEKLKNYAPTIFTEKMADKDYDGDNEIETSEQEFLGSRDKAIKKSIKDKSMKAKSMKESIEESDDDLLEEDAFIEELQALVESIENDIGEELTESEIEELANILMEESDPDEDEEEDFEEDFEEEDYEEEEKTK